MVRISFDRQKGSDEKLGGEVLDSGHHKDTGSSRIPSSAHEVPDTLLENVGATQEHRRSSSGVRGGAEVPLAGAAGPNHRPESSSR